ncbi:MAG TPA: hypothetical protein VFP72_07845, partial [Kineosporiaceae bacterium]|nr:hypothetical protein [Kineosporiaceae bacterium]
MLPRLLRSIRTFRNDPSQADESLPVPARSAAEPADAETMPAEPVLAETVFAEPVLAETGPAEDPRRAEHALREPVRAAGPKIGLVALGLSVLTVTALAVGTLQGLRSDQASPAGVTGQAMLAAARQADLLDGRQQDVAGARA